jgi:hypothetical protein
MINLQVIENSNYDEIEIDDGELRVNLRKALEQRDAALAVRDKAAATIEAVDKQIGVIDSLLSRFAQLDDDLATARANDITMSLEAGDGLPPMRLSAELEGRVMQRIDATERRAAFEQAAKKLRADLEEANATLRARQAEVDKAALRIVGCVADQRARELRLAEQATASLRRQLLGACVTRPPGSQIPLAPATLKLLRDDSASALVSKNDTSGAGPWNRLFTKLCGGDSEARLDEF